MHYFFVPVMKLLFKNLKNALAYYNAAAVVVNSKAEGLALVF
jgi:hypothetical protein